MTLQKPTRQELERKFKHHPPQGDQAERYAEVRKTLAEAAVRCVELTPASPQQEMAINNLHTAMMLFNAAIAINEGKGPEETEVQKAARRGFEGT